MSEILDGRRISKRIRSEVEAKVKSISNAENIPTLAIVLATKNESALAYVNIIKKAAEKVGINANIADLGENATQSELETTIKELAENKKVHGIILQTPVDTPMDIDELRALIPLDKDIDGANPLSAGRLFSDLSSFAPATAAAVIEVLKDYKIEIASKNAVVVGRSRIVGKPVAHMLISLDATVTICHSATKNLPKHTKEADILVVAAGKINLINKQHISPNTTVIDVGTNFTKQGKLVGDVDYESVEPEVKAITPVPGGVGPITTAILLSNTLKAYLTQQD